MVLHLTRGLVAGLDSVDGLAGGTLQAAVLVAVVVHSNKALEVVLVTTLRQAAYRLGPGDATHAGAFVAGWSGKSLHADGAVLRWEDKSDLWLVQSDMDRVSSKKRVINSRPSLYLSCWL